MPRRRSRLAAQAKTAQQGADVRFVAGGTTLLDLMKLNVETPARLLDINRLPLDKIEATPDGGLKIGATVRNSDLAHHPTVQRDYAVLSQAILAGASAQLRNMATTAGNLLQRTRCVYFRDTAMPCNKREPGTGCPAITGSNRTLAILGTSEHCIATNPSDMCVAMAALEATIHVQGPKGPRAIPIGDFHLLPGNTPQRETVLEPGDLITHVTLPPPVAGSKQVYLKLRDRASYEFALASAAVVLTVAGGKVTRARVALGGVGTKPWRSPEAEAALVGQPANAANFRKAAEAALRDAKPQSENGFKIELAKRCLAHALQTAATSLIPPKERACRRHKKTRRRPRSAARTPRVDGPLKVTRDGAVRLRLPLSRDALCRAGRGDDRQRPRGRARHGRRRENARRARDLSSREHRKDLPLGRWGRDSKASPTSAGRRSRTMSFATTASTSRSPSRTRSRAPRPPPMRFASRTRRSKPERRHRPQGRTTSPTWSPPRSAPPSACRASAATPRGAFAAAPVKLDQTYVTPAETHNPIELHATTAIWDGDDADALRSVAGRRQPPRRARADVRPAEGERPRHHEIRRLGLRQQAVAVDALRARRRGGAAARQAGQARRQPQDDVPDGRSSSAHPAARAPRRDARRQARLAPARLRQPRRRSSTTTTKTAARRRRSSTACRISASRSAAPGATSARRPPCAAPAPCPGSTRPNRR